MRGIFTTDAEGRYAFVTTRPVDYSVPTDGPVGSLLEATGRTSMRPAHTHLIVTAEGYHPVTTHFFFASAIFPVSMMAVTMAEPSATSRRREGTTTVEMASPSAEAITRAEAKPSGGVFIKLSHSSRSKNAR